MKLDDLIIEIKKHLPSDSKYWRKSGHYHGSAPYRAGSDSKALHIDFAENRYYDHVALNGGSLKNLAVLLGVQGIEGYTPVKTELPANLAEYELYRRLPENHLKDKNWQDGTFDNRPCIFIPTPANINQVRFLDNNDPKYTWQNKLDKDESGKGKNPIYGLRSAIAIAKKNKLLYLVQTNGAISSEVAQFHGIPAFAVLGGEGNCDKRHIDVILGATDLHIVVILDCDKAGQNAAKNIIEMYGNRGILVELSGEYGSGFDLCDFCILFENASPANEIDKLVSHAYDLRPARTIAEAGLIVIKRLSGERMRDGRIIPMPFASLHQFGGNAFAMKPNFISGIVGVSGGGKTSFWQTLVQLLLRQTRNWGIIVDAREFKPEDDFERHALRELSVINPDDIVKHEIYQQMQSENHFIEPDEKKLGKLMTDDKFNALLQFQANEKYRFGHFEYADEFDYIEDTLDYMYRRTMELRQDGKYVDLWIFDYLTLYRATQKTMQGVGDNIYNVILSIIKAKTRRANIHSIVMLQPNKEPTLAQKANNHLLSASDINFVNENHFNFLMSINVLYGTQSEWVNADHHKGYAIVRESSTGKPKKGIAPLKQGGFAAMWKGLKNTTGKASWLLPVVADYKRMRWLDERWIESDLCLPLNAGDNDSD